MNIQTITQIVQYIVVHVAYCQVLKKIRIQKRNNTNKWLLQTTILTAFKKLPELHLLSQLD